MDQTLIWADPLNQGTQFTPYAGPIPICTHLHGGVIPSAYDGGPDAWFTPNSPGNVPITGPGYVTNIYKYPNDQEAATVWFHDHALGITRLTPHMGLAAFYLIKDPANEPMNLPSGPYDQEIAIQDRLFDTNGQLVFPAAGINPTIHPFWMPEFFGDTIVVNDKTWPYFKVEPRRYRLRLLQRLESQGLRSELRQSADPGVHDRDRGRLPRRAGQDQVARAVSGREGRNRCSA